MKIKVSEATPLQLDWLVVKCEGMEEDYNKYGFALGDCDTPYSPATNWNQGGPIIERERMNIKSNMTRNAEYPEYDWMADCPEQGFCCSVNGPTPLIAAMRCYVISKLGDEVEVPNELL